jgi:hypothetical protein
MNLRALCLLGLIATSASASASTPVEVERVDSVVRVSATIEARASPGLCFSVLTDFDPPHEFKFTKVAGNLRQMRGRWHVAGDTTHCTIDYRAEIEPDFWIPPLIGPLLIKQQVREQVDALVVEIHRRAQVAPVP